jgi:2-dehydro-3-deoxy-D-arabinonate dehydratase
MRIVRYELDGEVHIGLCSDDVVTELDGVPTLGHLWRLPAAQLRERLRESASRHTVPRSAIRLLAPIDATTEVWACGVTYEVSRGARIEESERAADVYALVYDAVRPEVFFKSVGLVPPTPFTLADGDTVRITIDSIGTLDNPVRRGVPEES